MSTNVVLKISGVDETKAAFASVKQNLTGFTAGLDSVKARMESLQPTFQKMAVLGGAIFSGITIGAVKAKENAVALSESINAVNVVFGDGAQEVLAYGRAAAESVGMSNAAYNQMATVTGALLKDTGLSMRNVAEMTNDLTVRAADMASVFNTDVSDALSAINQAIRGETEAIRRYAGDVTDATLQQYLLSKGIKTTVSELSEQEKRLYRVELIMAQTAVTAGDFERTSDSLANRERILRAQFEDMSATLGTQLIPMFESLYNTIAPVIASVGEWIEQNPNLAKNLVLVTGAVGGVVAIVGTLGLALPGVIGAIKTLTTVIYAARVASLALLGPWGLVAAAAATVAGVVGVKMVSASKAATSANQSLYDGTGRLTWSLGESSAKANVFGGSLKSMSGEASKAADAIKKLNEEAAKIFGNIAKDEASSKQELAEAIVEQEEKVKDIRNEIRQIERDERKADSNEERRTLEERREVLERQLQEERDALKSAGDLRKSIKAEIQEAERRADLTEFERLVEDIQRRRVERLKEQATRLIEIKQEIAAEQTKNTAIQSSFAAAQENMRKESGITVQKIIDDAKRAQRAVSSIFNSGPSSFRTSNSTANMILPGRAAGGPVTARTPYKVGERGEETFIPSTSGRIVPNYAMATGGQSINVYISGNNFMGEEDMAERVGDKLINLVRQEMRL